MVAITAPAPASPKLCKALQDAKQAGQTYVIIDGTLCPRPGGRRPAICSGKHRHGMNKVMAIPHRGHRDECPGRCPAQPTT